MSEDIYNLTTFEQRLGLYFIIVMILFIQGISLLQSFNNPSNELFYHIKRLNTAGEIATIQKIRRGEFSDNYAVILKAKRSQVNLNDVKQSLYALRDFFISEEGKKVIAKFRSSSRQYFRIEFCTQPFLLDNHGETLSFILLKPEEFISQ